jgi:endoglucanase
VKRIALFLSFVLFHISARSAGIVAIDQAGYLAKGQKVAVLTSPADSFVVTNVHTGAIAFRGAVRPGGAPDVATGTIPYYADFSSLTSPGMYSVRVTSGDSSLYFPIADTVLQPVYRSTLRSYFLQRCGMELPKSLAGPWWHIACHVETDGVFHPTAEGSGAAGVSGGWHDAGDYGKYIVNAGVTAGTLLLAYEMYPMRFNTDDLRIPESGNSVPDLLDEVRYELEWCLTMQAGDGGVFSKVTGTSFEGFVMPENDVAQRYIYRISSTATADFAAAMAQASRVFKPFDPGFSARCLSAARKAWNYLHMHPMIVPPGGFRNPEGTRTGEYGDTNDRDERLWASVELYCTTGDSAAHAYFRANYALQGLVKDAIAWPNVGTLAQFQYLRSSRADVDTKIQGSLRAALMQFCESTLALHDASGFRTALSPQEYSWGSNSKILNNALVLLFGRSEGGSARMEDAAMDQLHYVLGVNALGYSFITGIGPRSARHPHHRPSEADGVADPVPGLVVGGPNSHIGQDAELKSTFTSSTPPALCYLDTMPSYASNETAINWNAPLVFLAGYFAGATPSESNPELRPH